MYVKCNIATDVSEENVNISNGTSHKSNVSTSQMCLISNDKCISNNSTYNKGGIGCCEMGCDKEQLVERSKYRESDHHYYYYYYYYSFIYS